MSKRLPWFRMYTDFLNDPKLISLAFEDQRHFIGVLALKCDGAIDDVADGDLLDRIVAQRLWIDHAVIREVKRRLIAAGLIDARWQPLAWEKRQMRSDVDATGAERQRRYREAQKHNALRDAAVTRLDTDTDTDTDTPNGVQGGEPPASTDATPYGDAAAPPAKPNAGDKKIELPDWMPAEQWADFVAMRRQKGKRAPFTVAAAKGIVSDLGKLRERGQDVADVLHQSVVNGWSGVFPVNDARRAATPQNSAIGAFV